MRVLCLTKSFSEGGSASGASNLVDALKSAGIEVICFDAYEAQMRSLRGVIRVIERITERTLYDAETHCLRLGPPAFDLIQLASEYRPDIIQLCDISGNVVRFADLLHVRCPIVHRMSDFWPYHGPAHYATTPGEASASAKWLFERTISSGAPVPDVCVSPSHWLAQLVSTGNHAKPWITIIRNATAVGKALPTTKPTSSEVRFGFISNSVFDPRKGFQTIRPKLEALASKGIKVSLHVFGRIKRSQIPASRHVQVDVHHRFGRGDLGQVFNSFEILLCPSKLDNSPNVVCESLAHGRPVIAQRGTGIDSYLTEKTGALIDFWNDTEAALAAFVAAYERMSKDYESYSHSAQDYAFNHLSPQVIGATYRRLYSDLLRIRGINSPLTL